MDKLCRCPKDYLVGTQQNEVIKVGKSTKTLDSLNEQGAATWPKRVPCPFSDIWI